MRIVILTPGAGGMYCGNCFRDNALAVALQRQGHDVLLLPLYLPMTLDEATAVPPKTPTFFGGINVFLSHKIPWYRKAPGWLRRWFDAEFLLSLVSKRAANTDASILGELNLSMVRGEEGNQTRELDELIQWLKTQPVPDAILLSNALLVGFVRRLKQEIRTRVIVCLQGEEAFLDSMIEPWRTRSWEAVAERGAEADGWITASRYFANRMGERLGIPSSRLHIVRNGIHLAGYNQLPQRRTTTPGEGMTLGFFARMCPEKGLDIVVDAFISLRQSGRWNQLRLAVGGGCGPAEEAYVKSQRNKLAAAGLSESASFHPNVSREEKIRFYSRCDILSVPARQSEAFGLYLIESWAAGTPVIQPELVTYPELLKSTGGGVLYTPNTATALAARLEQVLAEPERLRSMGDAGRRAVFEDYSDDVMAREVAVTIGRIEPPISPSLSLPQLRTNLRS